jgi:hypothetical protein
VLFFRNGRLTQTGNRPTSITADLRSIRANFSSLFGSTASELRSLSKRCNRGDDGNCRTRRIPAQEKQHNHEPRRIFDLEVPRGICLQVPSLPDDWHPAYEERTRAQVGGVDFPVVRFLAMDRGQRLELLQNFFRQLFLTAKDSLDCIDMLKLGIPEEEEVARLLESFNQAVTTSKEIDRYLNDTTVAPEVVSEKDDAPEAAKLATVWKSQDDSFGMR